MGELEICHVRLACDHVLKDRFQLNRPQVFAVLPKTLSRTNAKRVSRHISRMYWAALLVS